MQRHTLHTPVAILPSHDPKALMRHISGTIRLVAAVPHSEMHLVVPYLKLPSWFKVPTPVGEYNPDWAIVMEDRDEHGQPTGNPFLYLVRETKDRNWKANLRPDEQRKIQCGERHFKGALGVNYKVVTKASELP